MQTTSVPLAANTIYITLRPWLDLDDLNTITLSGLVGIQPFDASQPLQETWSEAPVGNDAGTVLEYRHGLLDLSSWNSALGHLVLRIRQNRVMYAGRASGYSFTFQVVNGPAEQQAPVISVGASGVLNPGHLLPASPGQGDLAPLMIRFWEHLSSSQQRGAGVNHTSTIVLKIQPRATLRSGSMITVVGFKGCGPDEEAIQRGKDAMLVGASGFPMVPLQYAGGDTASAGSFALWIPATKPPSWDPEAPTQPAKIVLTLASNLNALEMLEVSFSLVTGLMPQSAVTLTAELWAGAVGMPTTLVANPRTFDEGGECETQTLYLNSIRLMPLAPVANSPFTCVQWSRDHAAITMYAQSTIPEDSLIAFDIAFDNIGSTQQAPPISIGLMGHLQALMTARYVCHVGML